jgi:hypothetical protein
MGRLPELSHIENFQGGNTGTTLLAVKHAGHSGNEAIHFKWIR